MSITFDYIVRRILKLFEGLWRLNLGTIISSQYFMMIYCDVISELPEKYVKRLQPYSFTNITTLIGTCSSVQYESYVKYHCFISSFFLADDSLSLFLLVVRSHHMRNMFTKFRKQMSGFLFLNRRKPRKQTFISEILWFRIFFVSNKKKKRYALEKQTNLLPPLQKSA